jgi:hypothetical protein
MKSNVLRDAAKTGERVVERFTASKEAVSDAWDDTRQFATRTRRTVRDLLGDAKYNIKRFPFRSVALAFSAGAVTTPTRLARWTSGRATRGWYRDSGDFSRCADEYAGVDSGPRVSLNLASFFELERFHGRRRPARPR